MSKGTLSLFLFDKLVCINEKLTPIFFCVTYRTRTTRIKSAISQFLSSVKQLHTDKSFKFDSLGEFSYGRLTRCDF